MNLTEAKALLLKRAAAREAKDWAEADRLRAELANGGWEVRDTPDGQTFSKAHIGDRVFAVGDTAKVWRSEGGNDYFLAEALVVEVNEHGPVIGPGTVHSAKKQYKQGMWRFNANVHYFLR